MRVRFRVRLRVRLPIATHLARLTLGDACGGGVRMPRHAEDLKREAVA